MAAERMGEQTEVVSAKQNITEGRTNMKPTLYKAQSITDQETVIAVYDTHPEVDAAVKDLQQGGFDMKKLSLIGKDHQTDEQVVGYYNAGAHNRHAGFFGLGRDCLAG